MQVSIITPNWKKSILPWMQIGKKFQRIRLSKELLNNYYFNGVKKEVDFEAECVNTPNEALEFIMPISGESMYTQFL